MGVELEAMDEEDEANEDDPDAWTFDVHATGWGENDGLRWLPLPLAPLKLPWPKGRMIWPLEGEPSNGRIVDDETAEDDDEDGRRPFRGPLRYDDPLGELAPPLPPDGDPLGDDGVSEDLREGMLSEGRLYETSESVRQ